MHQILVSKNQRCQSEEEELSNMWLNEFLLQRLLGKLWK
jgi:hypothetical protein